MYNIYAPVPLFRFSGCIGALARYDCRVPTDGGHVNLTEFDASLAILFHLMFSFPLLDTQAHLSHDAAKKTLSMALLRVYLNSYTNLFRGTLQVQACLLRDGSRLVVPACLFTQCGYKHVSQNAKTPL